MTHHFLASRLSKWTHPIWGATIQCWLNPGPPSAMLAHCSTNIGSMYGNHSGLVLGNTALAITCTWNVHLVLCTTANTLSQCWFNVGQSAVCVCVYVSYQRHYHFWPVMSTAVCAHALSQARPGVRERKWSNTEWGKGAWRIGRAPDCLASHACIPGSSPADPAWVFQRNIRVYPFSMWLGDHVNGCLVELNLNPVYRR